MKKEYFIGIDPITTKNSKGALVTMKRTPQGMEVIKIMKWHEKHQWSQKLKVKFYLWKMKRLYRNVHVIKETNEPSKPKSYFKKETLTGGLNPDEMKKIPSPNYLSTQNIDLKEHMQEQHKGEIHNTIDDMIKYLRIMEKEYQAGEREISGIEILTKWLQDGTIKAVLYFKIRQAIENPEAPYNIKIK